MPRAPPFTPPADWVELRSDTFTKPTPEMREAMAAAEVGNAAFGEDPTLRELEEKSARVLGKEAGLFVPSGTMGNSVAVRVHTARVVNPEVVCEARAHVYLSEAAAIATVSGAQVRPVPGERGVLAADAVRAAITVTDYPIKPRTALVCLENTHNYAGGTVARPEQQAAVRAVADEFDVPVHLDGARVFNAAAALGVDPAELARDAASVQFCFSKALGAPVGSMLVGDADFIEQAGRVRQYLGGTLRQAGVLAAPALVGLEKERHRLGEDHARAKRLAKGVADAPGLRLVTEPATNPADPSWSGTVRALPETNIVVWDASGLGVPAARFVDAMRERGVGMLTISPTEVRAVTHRDVDDDGIARAIEAAHDVARSLAKA